MVSAIGGKKTAKKRVGQQLREARLARRLTVDEVAVGIRIPPKQLRALEDGNFNVFSAEIYAKGAYTKYAAYLGVDNNDTWHSFLRTLAGASVQVPLRIPIPATWWQRALTPTGVVVLVVGLIVLAVAGYISWQVVSFVRVPELELLEPLVPVVEGPDLTIKGRAEKDAVVEVNGERVLLNDGGEFEYVLPVKDGINVLEVRASGASGRLNTITKHLLVPRNKN